MGVTSVRLIMRSDPATLQRRIASSPEATARVLAYLDSQEQEHSGLISGATLAAVCGVDSRRWRRWVSDGEMPVGARRLLEVVAWPGGPVGPGLVRELEMRDGK